MKSFRIIAGAMATWLLAACAHAEQPAIPSRPCVLVSGGGGPVFSDQKVDQLWLAVSQQITDFVVKDLRAQSYDVESVFTDAAERDMAPSKVMLAVARTQCAQILQIGLNVSEDTGGRYFAYEMAVLRLVPKERVSSPTPGTNVVVASDYNKSYRFPRTVDTMENFYTGTFAHQAVDDVVRAGVLRKPERRAATEVTDAEVRAEYDRYVALHGDHEYKIRHILVETQADAHAALDRIKAGESFDSVARAVSKDPGSASQGGDLGWSVPRDFVPEFGAAMVALAPRGLAVAPIRSTFGWHVIEVTDVRPSVFPPFESVKGQIVENLRKRKAAGS